MVLDTSAIMAILLGEEEAPAFRDLIARANRVWVSAATTVELAAVSSNDDDLFAAAQSFLSAPYVHIEPVDAVQAAIAAGAYRRYGKGHHPANLNLGDVFSYALAQKRGMPLLFKGNDFSWTDIEAAREHPGH